MNYNTTLKPHVLEKYKQNIFIETGTLNGDAVQLAIDLKIPKIYSIEIDEKLQKQNIEKFKTNIKNNEVYLIVGDSEIELEKILKNINESVTIWLDSHWDGGVIGNKKCPLYEELEAIKKFSIRTNIFPNILIDDLRCFGGGNWGENIYLNRIIEKIFEINPNYKIEREDGFSPGDVLGCRL